MKKFIGYLYLLIKPILLIGVIMFAHSLQMSINWGYYDQYGQTGGYLKEQYLFLGLGYLLAVLVIWIKLYFKKKQYYDSAEILFDKGINKYLTLIINILIVIIILAFFILLIPYWVIDVPNGDLG